MTTPLVTELRVRDFRTVGQLSVDLGCVCALVGEPQTGKSNILAALRAAVDPAAAVRMTPDDVRAGAQALELRARLAGGRRVGVTGRPPETEQHGSSSRPPVLFLPAAERARDVAARDGPDQDVPTALASFQRGLRRALHHRDGAPPAAGLPVLIEAFEAACHDKMAGVLVLIEEPEDLLRPQEQRYLSRLLRRLAAAGNQVVYATHSPAFLSVARMDELIFVERREETGTKALRPPPLTPDEDFRVLSAFDAERAEVFLARAAILVEGETEKLALPFVFAALGEDADREGISVVECGGKANLMLFAHVCRAAGVPFVVLYDRDARPGRRPSLTDRTVHARLAEIAGPGHTVELAPDFEAVSHLSGSGRKPERAWRRFATLPPDRMPADLVRAVRLTVALAREPGRRRPAP